MTKDTTTTPASNDWSKYPIPELADNETGEIIGMGEPYTRHLGCKYLAFDKEKGKWFNPHARGLAEIPQNSPCLKICSKKKEVEKCRPIKWVMFGEDSTSLFDESNTFIEAESESGEDFYLKIYQSRLDSAQDISLSIEEWNVLRTYIDNTVIPTMKKL